MLSSLRGESDGAVSRGVSLLQQRGYLPTHGDIGGESSIGCPWGMGHAFHPARADVCLCKHSKGRMNSAAA